MNFYMNRAEYQILEVEQDFFKEIEEGDGYYYGQTRFQEQIIYLDRNLDLDRKRKTLYHELMHVYIREYITTRDIDTLSEELLCDLCANSHDIIHEIAEEYFQQV